MNRFILVVCLLATWCISAHGGQVNPKCDESHVAINHETKVKCYPKVQLQEKCFHDQQCKAITPYSICDSNQSGDDDEESVCQCRKGFIATGQQDACIPKRSCSMNSSNDSTGTNQTNEHCSSNQFCQNGVCLCLENYEFNELGQCVHSEQDEEDKSELQFSKEEEDKDDDKEEEEKDEEVPEKEKDEEDQEEYYDDQYEDDAETNNHEQKHLSPEDSSLAKLKHQKFHKDILKYSQNTNGKLDDIKRNLNKQDDNFRFFRYALILMCLMIVFLFVVIFLIQTRTIDNRNDQTATIRHDNPPRYSEHLKHQYLPVNTQS